jgi:2-keto-4-pentenoate hydratase
MITLKNLYNQGVAGTQFQNLSAKNTNGSKNDVIFGGDKMRQTRKSIFLIVSLAAVSSLLLAAAGQHAQGKDRRKANKMVKEMLSASENQTQIQYLTKTYGSFSIERAYQIQAALAKGLSQRLGSVVGYKVAYASKAAQKQFGMDEPARGHFFKMQRLPSGSKLSVESFNEITLETEVAFTLGKRIYKPVKDVAGLKPYVKWVHSAFDAGNFPYTAGQTKPTAQDMIAIGTGAHVFVLGPAVEPGKVDIDAVTLKLARNGKTIRESAATNVMGSPWNSLLWLANHVVKHGGELEPGDVVLTGTAAPAYKAKGEAIKGYYEGDCGALGKVALTIY